MNIMLSSNRRLHIVKISIFLVTVALITSAAGCGESSPVEPQYITQLAAGSDHTVGLKSDKTVVAVGDNSFLQCNVDNWKNIIYMDAGGAHTVALKSDGTDRKSTR